MRASIPRPRSISRTEPEDERARACASASGGSPAIEPCALRYQEYLRAVWADGGPLAARARRPTIERAVTRACPSLEHGLSPIELIPEGHIARRENFLPMTAARAARATLTLTPCYLAGGHGHIVALPGMLSVAIGTGVTTDMARQRAAAEVVARDLKLLSDPTSVLILTSSIASRHGRRDRAARRRRPADRLRARRQLREAGLLEATRDGNSSSYRVERHRLRATLQGAHDALLPAAELAGRR